MLQKIPKISKPDTPTTEYKLMQVIMILPQLMFSAEAEKENNYNNY